MGLFAGCLALGMSSGLAWADIYEWEYIDPLNPSLGRQASAVLLSTKVAGPGANLRDTNLRKAYFAGANLSGAGFGEYTIDFGLVIPAANLTDADFAGANLTGATLYRSPITGAFFTDAVIAGASLSDTSLTYQQFASTASYQSGSLAGVGLSYNNMAGWDLSNLNMANGSMYSSTLTGANLSNSTLTSVWFDYAELTGANFSGSDLMGARFQHADMPGADFSGANLTSARMWQTDLTNADFIGANLTNAEFNNGNLAGADLTDAIINDAWFDNVAFASPAQVMSTASYKAGDLSGLVMRGNVGSQQQDFSGIDLSGFNLTNVALRIVLDGADLSGADLTGASLDGSSFIGADFTDANITDAYFDTLSLSQLMSTANYKAKNLSKILVQDYDLSGLDLSGFNLSGFGALTSNLSGTDFSGADLTGAGLAGSELSGADFTDADIVGIGLNETTHNGFTYQQLASTASFKAGDLSGVVLAFNDLSGWDLSGLNLSGARLGNSVGPYFGGQAQTNLTDADLSGSDLTGVNFIRANLANTDFTDAVIALARFKDAVNLTEAQVRSTASYQNGDLTGIIWWNLDLSGWDLSGQRLAMSHFTAVSMLGADLSNADTRGSNLLESQIATAGDTTNLIWPDGSMRNGLVLSAGDTFRVRDLVLSERTWSSSQDLPGAITVHDQFVLDADSTLQITFTDPDWQSMIEFDPSVGTAYLGGMLELALGLPEGVDVNDLVGTTFQLFDWTGVDVVGGFDAIVTDPALYDEWLSFDLSRLMTDGTVRIIPMVGDLDGDGFVGILDLMVVLEHWQQDVTPGNLLQGDINGDGTVHIHDLNAVLGSWNQSVPPAGLGVAIPEPTAAVILSAGGACLLRRRVAV